MTSVTSSTTGVGFSYAGTTTAAQESASDASSSASSSSSSSSSSASSVGSGAGGGSSGSSSEIESETTTTHADGSKTVVIKYTDGTTTTKTIAADPAVAAQMKAIKGQGATETQAGASQESSKETVTGFNATV